MKSASSIVSQQLCRYDSYKTTSSISTISNLQTTIAVLQKKPTGVMGDRERRRFFFFQNPGAPPNTDSLGPPHLLHVQPPIMSNRQLVVARSGRLRVSCGCAFVSAWFVGLCRLISFGKLYPRSDEPSRFARDSCMYTAKDGYEAVQNTDWSD